MDKCEAMHYYICGEYRGRLKKKMDIKVKGKSINNDL